MMPEFFSSPHYPDPLRRRLLTALLLSPLVYSAASRGAIATPPDVNRIVALEWLPVELLLALGLTPLAIADKRNYNLWVKEPELPESVIDIGLRTEPNLELLAQIRPSMIIYSEGYGPSVAKMSRISPMLGFSFSSEQGKPLTSAQASLMKLADALNMKAVGERHLAELAQFLQQEKITLQPYTQRPLLLITLIDSRHALVIGKNSLFQEVMDHIGIENAWHGETSFWGSTIVGIESLANIGDANVLCFEHGDSAISAQLDSNPLWQAMPFVRQQRLQRVPAVWLYGGTLSAMRFCRVLNQALEAKKHA
ncbi:Fe(3+)-hydroxamate ABC transporter substrate-binding protein FhuD [Pectobacterium parmentieri]|uniref:Fe(3+)-hydroxamate ABC transporter substrate-binding protein FhuD n=1 Tax=Pectobacterium parmentieri TaxID=1905730 RepID=A0A0H3I5H2_PECPM|nr:Fe(3+)-hydroxamate ABC transporter substrate-binding protein FhuD [Pectobacterium parmentieri]ACX86984.1 periplasmic binding protein [Pectobacterium parmentieri WPP163]AFI89181.1 Ferrichrome-binding periplasmic protein [Pectobacterium parmentieri]AYH00462.1 Fe(3+)-hydroxamate ABC transporter substrate-binding protein FhuD [Pectobacterium parmentieri]AYH04906.1 Fe(3+)-hydroxamate ABC transporter substrate-binding protein FhuD [Pectobacterium parmentieri]AYH13728.1 Fe(3+)-hydroxamate ABC tran